MQTGVILSVNTSAAKGAAKHPADFVRMLAGFGVEGDAHAGVPNDGVMHRQVSILADESAEKLRAKGLSGIVPGVFGENLTVTGIEVWLLPVGTRLEAGEALLEVTQIGKECHFGCEIRRTAGDCVMPREGIFARVVREGTVRPGDWLKVLD